MSQSKTKRNRHFKIIYWHRTLLWNSFMILLISFEIGVVVSHSLVLNRNWHHQSERHHQKFKSESIELLFIFRSIQSIGRLWNRNWKTEFGIDIRNRSWSIFGIWFRNWITSFLVFISHRNDLASRWLMMINSAHRKFVFLFWLFQSKSRVLTWSNEKDG